MAGQPRAARTGLTLFFVAVLVATFFGPISASADTNLEIGGQARIAYANGDDVRLRESPGRSGSLISLIPEGSVVDVLDGPAEDDEGSLWYLVAFDGDTGYVISDYLALEGGGGGPAAGSVIGYATIAWTNNDGVRCRTEPSTGGAVITVVPEGATVELTDAAFSGWQPINCGGQGGYVSTEFVSYEVGGAADPGAEASFGAQSVTGTAMVAWTNGDGVNCRSSAGTGGSIITVIPEGSEVSLRGDARGDWQPVVCAGSNGYISTAFVDYDGSSGGGGGGGGGDEVTGTAYVDGTNGDGVRCRSSASMSGSIITVLPEGTEVSLRGGDSGGWQPVFCGGSQGYVSSEFLSIGDGGGGGGGGGSDVTGSALVTGTGNGLRCRASASFNADVLSVYGDGDSISLRGNVEGEWQPVFCGGTPGYVYASYLDYDGSGGGGSDDDGGGSSNAPFVAGDVVEITGTNGDGVNLRSGAGTSSSVVMVVGEGQTASVISGSTGNWVAVSYSGASGFIHMDYLGYSDSGSDDDDDGGGGGGGGIDVGEHAMTLDALNLRYDPSYSGGVAAVAPSGTVVEITGGRSNGFYAVNWDGLAGYMHGDYLTWTDEPLSSRGGGNEDGGGGGGDEDGGGGPTGGGVVGFAMQYVGYPYVWGSRGPSSFDCSGFTYWVMLNALGINIGGTTGAQWGAGSPVSRNALQPGDLVFFQNTYTWGLSHVGVYIGNGQFVHAQNESTGVVVSDMNSSYYSSRWYGARRVG